ncbi:hypothetical protein ABZ907_45520 [Nonomuraea wenchangensis]
MDGHVRREWPSAGKVKPDLKEWQTLRPASAQDGVQKADDGLPDTEAGQDT